MPKQFDLIIFDWDGTLADSAQVIVQSVQAASADAGLPVPDDNAVRGIIGMSLRPAIAKLFPDIEMAQLHRMVDRYNHHFLARDHAIALFDGVAAAMADLEERGFLLAVATGKGRRGLDHALTSSGIERHFVASRCADECHSKPHPQMLQDLMGELDVDPERTLMVGDTCHDLQMARNAGVTSLAVSYGAQTLEDLLPHAPLTHFDCFTNLHRWLIMNA